jgi:hypothetical protein
MSDQPFYAPNRTTAPRQARAGVNLWVVQNDGRQASARACARSQRCVAELCVSGRLGMDKKKIADLVYQLRRLGIKAEEYVVVSEGVFFATSKPARIFAKKSTTRF